MSADPLLDGETDPVPYVDPAELALGAPHQDDEDDDRDTIMTPPPAPLAGASESQAITVAQLGVAFGRYRLLEQIGEGSVARVYRAVVDGPLGFHRDIVIKRLKASCAADPGFVAAIAAEARICALLRHPSIVQVLDFGQVGDESFIAMELVDGCDLAGLLKCCRRVGAVPPVDAVCHIVSEVALALGYAHALADESGRPLQLVHRDVTPSNIMVTLTGAVKLLDFGLAKAADHFREERTRTGVIKGRYGYMSPEQTLGHALDQRSDLFSLGVVFYECLTGRPLFAGGSDVETQRRVCALDIPPPSRLNRNVPPAVDAVVLRMLARDRERRFRSGAEVAAALEPILERLGADRGALKLFLARVGQLASRTVARPRLDISDEATRTLQRPLTPTLVKPRLAAARGPIARGTAATLLAVLPVSLWLLAVRLEPSDADASTAATAGAPTRVVRPAAPQPAAPAPAAARDELEAPVLRIGVEPSHRRPRPVGSVPRGAGRRKPR